MGLSACWGIVLATNIYSLLTYVTFHLIHPGPSASTLANETVRATNTLGQNLWFDTIFTLARSSVSLGSTIESAAEAGASARRWWQR